jgi:hypothetical protein
MRTKTQNLASCEKAVNYRIIARQTSCDQKERTMKLKQL